MMVLEIKEGQPLPLEIKELKPLGVTQEILEQYGLIELVAKSYGFEGTPDWLLYCALREYIGNTNEKRTNFIALFEGKAVGSLSTTKSTPEEKEVGRAFWEDLRERSSNVYQRAINQKDPMTCFVNGIITHPDFRRKKVGKRLYDHLVRTFNPPFIIGDTKTPEAVLSRGVSLAFLYRTFYGFSEVTPHSAKKACMEHLPILESGYAAWQNSHDKGIWWAGSSELSPNVPVVEGFPPFIQVAFEDVIKEQGAENESGRGEPGRVATKSLISIRRDILL